MTHEQIVAALLVLRPEAVWSLDGDTLSGLTWLDTKQTRPTNDAILAQIAAQGS